MSGITQTSDLILHHFRSTWTRMFLPDTRAVNKPKVIPLNVLHLERLSTQKSPGPEFSFILERKTSINHISYTAAAFHVRNVCSNSSWNKCRLFQLAFNRFTFFFRSNEREWRCLNGSRVCRRTASTHRETWISLFARETLSQTFHKQHALRVYFLIFRSSKGARSRNDKWSWVYESQWRALL